MATKEDRYKDALTDVAEIFVTTKYATLSFEQIAKMIGNIFNKHDINVAYSKNDSGQTIYFGIQ